jgi:AraC-like DNA-binding protein
MSRDPHIPDHSLGLHADAREDLAPKALHHKQDHTHSLSPKPLRDVSPQAIHVAAPDETIRGLLALSLARSVQLTGGDSCTGRGEAGESLVLAALDGSATIELDKGYALLTAGQVAVFAPEKLSFSENGQPAAPDGGNAIGEYTVRAITDCQCILLHLTGTLLKQLLLEGEDAKVSLVSAKAAGEPLDPDGLEQSDDPQLDRTLGRVIPAAAPAVRALLCTLGVLQERHDPVDAHAASSHLYEMLLHLRTFRIEHREVSSPLVEAAVSIIQAEFPFLDGIDELAERLEVSKAHLSRCFSQKVGVSPAKYITRVRIAYAKLLLQDESLTITNVAEASGFACANYFAKVFRRETGMSPSQYLESVPKEQQKRPKFPIDLDIW